MNPAELGEAFRGDEAADWLEAAAACGLVEAQLKLGRMLLTGDGMPIRPARGFCLFPQRRRRRERGSPQSAGPLL